MEPLGVSGAGNVNWPSPSSNLPPEIKSSLEKILGLASKTPPEDTEELYTKLDEALSKCTARVQQEASGIITNLHELHNISSDLDEAIKQGDNYKADQLTRDLANKTAQITRQIYGS